MDHDARAVANVLYKLARAEREKLTNMQIQKLVYIAHGCTLGVFDEALIGDQVEAWEYGPVIPTLYHAYKGYGAEAIRHRLSTSTRPIEIDSREYQIIQTIFATYGRFSGPQLSALTHKPGTPWHQIWEPERRRKPIPNSLIKAHYSGFKTQPSPPANLGIEDLEYAASLDDVHTFVGLVKETKWQDRSVEDIVRLIQLALDMSVPTAAELAYSEGIKLYPDSQGLAKYSRLLTPPVRRSPSSVPPNPTLKKNREWLKAHRAKYRGQWIALRDGQLLGIASSLEDLKSRLDDTANTLLTRA